MKNMKSMKIFMGAISITGLILQRPLLAHGQVPTSEISSGLRKAALRTDALVPEDVALLQRALSDPDGQTRLLGREMVASRVHPWRVLKAESRGPYLSDIKALQSLRPLLLTGLREGLPVHRRAAVQSIGYLSLTWVEPSAPPDPAAREMSFDIDAGTLTLLTRHFAQEVDAGVRNEVIGLLAGTRHKTPEPNRTTIASFLRRAVADSEWSVVNSALLALGRRTLPEGLTEGARLLKHPAHQVRMVAAQVVASYRADAKPYLPDLRAALTVESDDITSKTIQGAITAIEKGGASCSSCSSW
jgi:hypothetical protein